MKTTRREQSYPWPNPRGFPKDIHSIHTQRVEAILHHVLLIKGQLGRAV